MKSLSKNLQTLKETVSQLYYASLNNINKLKKINKKMYKDIVKTVSKQILSLPDSQAFFNTRDNSSFENIFLFDALGINPLDQGSGIISYIKYLDVNILLKDKEFVIFLKNIMITDLIYQLSNHKNKIHPTNYFNSMQTFYGDIRKVFLSYFLLKEKNITLCKVQNITSYFLKDAMFYTTSMSLTKEQQEIFNQLHTGIKYEKQKPGLENNLEPRVYNKREKFDILEKVSKTIKIHYFTGKNGKHSYHESPKTHIRKGHFRTYKHGKKVWIPEMTINESGRVP